MDTPLYEYDQVITCDELLNLANELVTLYKITPKWKFIERFKLRIELNVVIQLHETLHLKSKIFNQFKGDNQ